MRAYETLRRLREGGDVDVGLVKVKMDRGKVQAGDLYVAERTGPKLLTSNTIVMASCGCCVDYVITNEFPEYAYDGGECVKVCEA